MSDPKDSAAALAVWEEADKEWYGVEPDPTRTDHRRIFVARIEAALRAAREEGKREALEEAAKWHETRAQVARHRHSNGDTLTAVDPPSFLDIALNHESHAVAIRALFPKEESSAD